MQAGGLLSVAIVSCAAHRSPLPPPAAASVPPPPSASELRVALTWSAPVDLDLYLTDPTWETVYFANTPSRTGARLLQDICCRDVHSGQSSFIEVAAVAEPVSGPYRVGVDFIDACTAPHDPVSFRVVADYGGVRREATGTIRLEEFEPIVVEFELQRTGADVTLTLVAVRNAEL